MYLQIAEYYQTLEVIRKIYNNNSSSMCLLAPILQGCLPTFSTGLAVPAGLPITHPGIFCYSFTRP